MANDLIPISGKREVVIHEQKPQKEIPTNPVSEKREAVETQEEKKTEDKKKEFIGDKFSKTLEDIGGILQKTVELQHKEFKNEYIKVERTFNNFVANSEAEKDVIEKGTEAQKDLFKELTEQFIKYRADENADAEQFHKDLLASMEQLYSVGGTQETTEAIDKMIREAMKTSPVKTEEDKRLEKKWQLSEKEKDSWSYKLFGMKDEISEISPDEVAKRQGQADFLSKGLFKEESKEDSKTPTEKMLEAILKNTERKQSEKGGSVSDKIEKLSIGELVIEKIGGRLGQMLERIGMREKPKQVDHETESYEALRKKATSVEDVDFVETVRPEAKPVPEKVQPSELIETHEPHKQLTYDKPSTPEAKPVPEKVQPISPLLKYKKTETAPELSPMAKAVKTALSTKDAYKPRPTAPIVATKTNYKPDNAVIPTMATPTPIVADKTPETSSVPMPMAKEDVKDVPEKEDEEKGGLIDALSNLLPDLGGKGKPSGKAGKLGKLAKVGGLAAAGYAAYSGISDEMSGKKVESLGDIVPEGMDALNPFSYAMNVGRYAGNKLNEGIKGLSGGKDLGSMAYDLLHPEPTQNVAPKVSREGVELEKKSEEVRAAKEEQVAQQAAPVIVNNSSPAPQSAPAITTANYLPVTAGVRNRDSYFDRRMDKVFVAK